MPLIEISTLLSAPIERVASEVACPKLMRHVAAPLLRFDLLSPSTWPAQWVDRGQYRVAIRLFGLIPMGWQEIRTHIARAEAQRYEFEDRGFGMLVKLWHHRIVLQADGEHMTRYTDQVEVRAGWLTPFAVAFAWGFYRWRQYRWHRLIARHFDYSL
jgi:hypothetical protein